MQYQEQLAFLRQLLSDMNMTSCIVKEPEKRIPPEIDRRLRAELFGLDNYVDFLQNSMSQAKAKTIYRFFDEYDCNYIFLQLPDASYFFMGPYLMEMPSKKRIQEKAVSLGLNEEQEKRMQLYYAALPLIEDENLLLTMVNTLAKQLWGEPEQYVMEYVEYAIPDRYEPIPFSVDTAAGNAMALSLQSLEQNYANENLLMDAVSKGKLHLVTAVASSVYNNGAEQRLADSLRDRKNNLVILKTLLRKAAEYGGVHPLHIHRLSSSFAEQIENTRSIKQSWQLQEKMIRSFCNLVKQQSLSEYSLYVAQAITMVQFDLTADLSLKAIAAQLNVNPSYLSNLFHKECGCTLTEFVNRQRVEKAALLLRNNNLLVQDVAAECGIQDANYFIKLFKKYTGLTPNRYRQQM